MHSDPKTGKWRSVKLWFKRRGTNQKRMSQNGKYSKDDLWLPLPPAPPPEIATGVQPQGYGQACEYKQHHNLSLTQPNQSPSPTQASPHTSPPPSISSENSASEPAQPTTPAPMPTEQELRSVLNELHNCLRTHNYTPSSTLLSQAKLHLLQLNALIPSASTSAEQLSLALETLELGALLAIRQRDPHTFTRYFQQLQPFYALPSSALPRNTTTNASKITGLYLLLLLSQGDYLSFHMVLEGLEQAGKVVKEDEFVMYPVRLEQALMEGSYDRVWGETKGERVPSEEFALFSEVLIPSIRHEIASCSERAYASVPLSNAKNLFFLESDGAVVAFAKERGWLVKDSRIYFPRQDSDLTASEKDILSSSGQVIENTLGYARELETIV